MAELLLPAHERKPLPLWRNFNFQILWLSVAAAGFGDRFIHIAAWAMLGYYVEGSQGASITAGVSFFFFLPYVILGTPAGWLADTLPRKWIMFACDQGRAVILFTAMILAPVGALVAVEPQHYWKIYALVAAVGSLAAIFSPAKAATVPQVVPASQLQPANAIVLGIAVIASLIGYVIGERIIRQSSVGLGLRFGGTVFIVSGMLFAFLRLPKREMVDREKRGEFRRMLDAATYTIQHKPVFDLTLLTVLFWAAANAFLAAIAALCKTRYDYPEGTATMMAVLGSGMLASSLWVAWMSTRRESSWFAMLNIILSGVAIFAVSLSRSYGLGLVLAFAVGFFGNAAMIIVATLTQSIAPDYIRGRVFGVRDFISTASAVVVNLVIWRLPDADVWMVPALYVLSALLIGVGAQGMWVQIAHGPLPTTAANIIARLDRSYALVWHRLKWIGRENVPRTGPVILAANHTAGVDPFLMQAAVPRLIRWVMLDAYRYRVANVLWNAIDPIAITPGAGDLPKLRKVLRVLEAGEVVGLFPEGGIQPAGRELQSFHPGIAMLAVRGGAAIVPVWIDGTPEGKRMFWHFVKPSRSRVIFGKAYKPDANLEHQAIVDDLRQRMLDLAASVTSDK